MSFSSSNVLRGLHYQKSNVQGKLVSVVQGQVFDVVVDIQPESSQYGQYISVILSDENHKQIYIPPGFAHGFCVTSNTALFMYKCTNYYDPNSECTIKWDDPTINIKWPIISPIVSTKDTNGEFLK